MRWWGAWPTWARWAAMAGSALHLVAGVVWATTGWGFPFGAADPGAADNGALLAAATPGVTGAVVAVLGGVGTATAWAMGRPDAGGPGRRRLLVGVGAALAVLLAVVLPERRAVLYLPPLGLLSVLRPPDRPTLHHLLLLVCGLAWAAATAGYLRAARGACRNCGRGPGAGPAVEAAVRRWGTPVTVLAAVAPWGYALVRVAWAAGVPVGVSPEFLARIEAANPGHGTVLLELVMAGFAAAGSGLTVGLLRPWGARFPRWVPGLAGRRVPPAFPVAFAGLASVGLTAWGVSMARDVGPFLAGGMRVAGFEMGPLWLLPPLAVLVWGPALGAAALAYHVRHRGPCRHCAAGPSAVGEPVARAAPDRSSS
jgi:hypothetical protein